MILMAWTISASSTFVGRLCQTPSDRRLTETAYNFATSPWKARHPSSSNVLDLEANDANVVVERIALRKLPNILQNAFEELP